MKPIAGAEIDAEAKGVVKRAKLKTPIDVPELAGGAAQLKKLNEEAQSLGDRIDRLIAAKAKLQTAIRERSLSDQLVAEAEILAVGAPLEKLTSSLLAVADRIVDLERQQERLFAESTAELAEPWWSAVVELKAKADDLARQAAVMSHAAARIANERGRVFNLGAVGVGTPRPWRATLRGLGYASRASR